jgi:hypothetical protein
MNGIARRVVAASMVVVGCSSAGMASADVGDQQPQRIRLVSVSRDGVDAPTRAVATGPVQDHGTATQVVVGPTEDGLLGRFELELRDGSVSGTFLQREFQLNFDFQACVARPNAAGTMNITGGTGEYVGASGSLEYTRTGVIVGARGDGGECLGTSAPPKVVVMHVHASGTASLSA